MKPGFRSQLVALLLVLTFAQACVPQATDTPFRPPTLPPPTQILPTAIAVPGIHTVTPNSTVTATPTEGPCFNDLEFVSDVTIPDGTTVSIGSTIDKQWLVKNKGTCNWDSTYRVKWIGGDPMGANQEQLLYPAHAETQVTIRILFTAPAVEGTYESTWQAYGPDGIAFGDLIYVKIVTTP
ncbi:MAG: hypothetical protein HY865_19495 [Chloroflexi bacterium]|nr:hypothetical protein [Chloroflexota bacterium]